MNSKIVKILIILAVVFSINSAFAEEQSHLDKYGSLTVGRYVAGGIVGTAVGFGIGHAIVGEYSRIGWLFTVTEGIGLGLLIGGCVDIGYNPYDPDNDAKGNGRGEYLIISGGLLLLAFNIWEIVDIWRKPASRLASNTAPGGIRRQRETSKFAVMPYAWKDRGGLAFAYRF